MLRINSHHLLPCIGMVFIAMLMSGCHVKDAAVNPSDMGDWDDLTLWRTSTEGSSTLTTWRIPAPHGEGIEVAYKLVGDFSYVELRHALDQTPSANLPVRFFVKARGSGDLEIKCEDADGSVFGRKLPLTGAFDDWTEIVVHTNHIEYWWGGDRQFSGLKQLAFAISGRGEGVVWFDHIGLSHRDHVSSLSPAGVILDPDRELPGYGIRQRRAAELNPEDSLVLAWLKQVQDTTTPEQQLLGSMEDQQLQTFNNALAAMAFIIKGEKERAERILDFFASATDRDNADLTRQNFFYDGEARGFFQYMARKEENGQVMYRGEPTSDRWMGDMFWLLFAYHHYDRVFGAGRYEEVERLMHDLLVSWYKESPQGHGGFVQHGWRRGDQQLHEADGHHEGNIDAYAYFKLIGDNERAEKIRQWLESSIGGNNLPLDLYTWRVLAYGQEAADLMKVPDYDLRFRKTVHFNGHDVVGVWHGPDAKITDNIWIDGVGHMACAYFAAGDDERGNFYANQLDALLIDRTIGGIQTRGLPYTVSRVGGYDWVQLDKGFVSASAWYIFAKNKFNPMTLK